MFEELNTIIGNRVKEVLQFHLKGTQEDFDAAASAVMTEFTSMGSSLADIVSESGGVHNLENADGRDTLAEKLTNAIKNN